MSDTRIILHPFKMGIRSILERHFSPDIVKRFWLEFEIHIYNADMNKAIQRQKRDNNLVLEVKYMNPDSTAEYICDVYSWESKARTEAHLLQFITDKFKAGKIGKDWELNGDKLVINPDIEKGTYATPDEPTAGNPNPTGRLHGRGKGNRKARG